MNLAIVIGVEKYQSKNFNDLPACKNDARVIRDILNNVKKVEDILFLNNNEAGYEVKRQLVDFIEKYKDEEIKELFFYFTGHGERYDDDFFYILSDFDSSRRQSTGLKNSELDNWIKTLSPNLCIKIVDACFSGTQYIKSGDVSTEKDLKNSAKKYGLNDIYFWFSSRENATSSAGLEFSTFTESILTGITELKGDVRYREIMDYVADDFSNHQDWSKPIFITQSDNIEKFGHVTTETHKIIYNAFGIDENNLDKNERKESIGSGDAPTKKDISFFKEISLKSDELCFNEENLLHFIEEFNNEISLWDEDILSIYTIEKKLNIEPNSVPNGSEIGSWLEKNKNINFFAQQNYNEKTFEVEEYIPLPKKPANNTFDIFSSSYELAGRRSGIFPKNETEYKLGTVTKKRKFIDGFYYTHNVDNKIINLSFIPKIELAEPLSLFVVPIYSNRSYIIHFSYEVLKRENWSSYSYPKCKIWKIVKVNINLTESYKKSANIIKKELKEWIEEMLINKI